MKTLAIIRIKLLVSGAQSIGIFLPFRQVNKSVASVVFALSHYILVLKHVRKAGEIEWIEYD